MARLDIKKLSSTVHLETEKKNLPSLAHLERKNHLSYTAYLVVEEQKSFYDTSRYKEALLIAYGTSIKKNKHLPSTALPET